MFKMIPKNCYLNRTAPNPYVQYVVSRNGEELVRHQGSVLAADYVSLYGFKKGDNITISVQMDWSFQGVHQDYSVLVYSKHNIKIVDENGQTNMLHYDG